jgi:hypothetical protein
MDIIHREHEGQKPGEELVKFLNDPQSVTNSAEELLADAQMVFRWLEEYRSLHELSLALKDKKIPEAFLKSYERLNESLATFTHSPQVDWHEFYDGNRVSWMPVAEKPPVALARIQVECIIQLLTQGTILKIRRCKECDRWYFALVSLQEYCRDACRRKHFANTEDVKQKRRAYQRERYKKRKSVNSK